MSLQCVWKERRPSSVIQFETVLMMSGRVWFIRTPQRVDYIFFFFLTMIWDECWHLSSETCRFHPHGRSEEKLEFHPQLTLLANQLLLNKSKETASKMILSFARTPRTKNNWIWVSITQQKVDEKTHKKWIFPTCVYQLKHLNWAPPPRWMTLSSGSKNELAAESIY